MTRLPTPGADNGTWGQVLNDYLSTAHQPDGSLKDIPQTKVTNLTTDLADKASLASVATKANTADVVLRSAYGANSILKADTSGTPLSLPVNTSTFIGRKSSGGIVALTPSEAKDLLDPVLQSASSPLENWLDIGAMGASLTISGVDSIIRRRRGTLTQNCNLTVTLTSNQQLDLLVQQDATGGRSLTFSGVDVWATANSAAPNVSMQAANVIDRFRIESIAGVTYGYWITEPVTAAPASSDTSNDIITITAAGVQPFSQTGFSSYSYTTSDPLGGMVSSTGAVNDAISFSPVYLRTGIWALVLVHRAGPDAGIYTIERSVDGTTWTGLGTVDGYELSSDNRRTVISNITIGSSDHYFIRLTMASNNASSSSFIGRISSVFLSRTGS